MKWNSIGFAIIAALCFSWLAQPAGAGRFIPDSIHIQASYDDPTIPVPYYHAEVLPDGNASLDVNETWGEEHGASYSFDIVGETDGDPIISISKDVANGTSLTWVGYKLDLDPLGAATFVGAPTSVGMTLTSQTSTSLVFGLPSPVPPSSSVTFNFDINVPSTGPFGFTLTQMPIAVPEPATCGLVLIATAIGVAIVRRRRS